MIYDFLKEKKLTDELEEEFSQYKVVALAWHYSAVLNQSQDRFKLEASKILSNKEYKKFIKLITKKKTLLENIFSVKNKTEDGVKRKILTILGIQFEINSGKNNTKKQNVKTYS